MDRRQTSQTLESRPEIQVLSTQSPNALIFSASLAALFLASSLLFPDVPGSFWKLAPERYISFLLFGLLLLAWTMAMLGGKSSGFTGVTWFGSALFTVQINMGLLFIGFRAFESWRLVSLLLSFFLSVLPFFPPLRQHFQLPPSRKKFLLGWSLTLLIPLFPSAFLYYKMASSLDLPLPPTPPQPFAQLESAWTDQDNEPCQWSKEWAVCIPAHSSLKKLGEDSLGWQTTSGGILFLSYTPLFQSLDHLYGYSSPYELEKAVWSTQSIPLLLAMLKRIIALPTPQAVYDLDHPALRGILSVVSSQTPGRRWRIEASLYPSKGQYFQLTSIHKTEEEALSPILETIRGWTQGNATSSGQPPIKPLA